MSIITGGQFDTNEWFLICYALITYLILYKLPKRFPFPIGLLLCMWGFSVSKFCDFTFGGGLFDYYDINDTPTYDLMDLLTYFIYAPYAYFFVYGYELLNIKPRTTHFYILAWAVLAIMMENLLIALHVVTYKVGYSMVYSFTVYLFTQTMTLLFYKWIRKAQ